MKNKTTVKIIWCDARIFSPNQPDVSISKMETRGMLEAETDDYLIIKNPTTINLLTNQPHPKTTPNFYLIPKVLIESQESIS